VGMWHAGKKEERGEWRLGCAIMMGQRRALDTDCWRQLGNGRA
jgi:hypothetical protein